jgi:stress response protein SCP2
MTNGEINRLGDKIREKYIKDSLEENTLNELQIYRTSHKDSLAKVFNAMCNLNRKMGKRSIVTYQLSEVFMKKHDCSSMVLLFDGL